MEYVGLVYSGYRVSLRPRLRVNNSFTLRLDTEYITEFNSIGHVNDSINNIGEQVIMMGTRDIQKVENVLDMKYIFTKNMALTLRARHYWYKLGYKDYFRLQNNGDIIPAKYEKHNNKVSNFFNVDLVYRWTFAPASELIFTWKNNIYAEKSDIVNNYFKDVRYTFNSPMGNSFSLKVLYYLDYQSLRKKNRKIEG